MRYRGGCCWSTSLTLQSDCGLSFHACVYVKVHTSCHAEVCVWVHPIQKLSKWCRIQCEQAALRPPAGSGQHEHTQTTTPITPKRKLSLISQSTDQLPKFSSWKIVQSGCEGAPGSSDKLAVHWGCKKTWNCLLVFCVFVCVCVLEDTKKGNFWIRCVTCLVQINKNVSNFSFIYSKQDTCVQQFATSRDTFQLIIHGSVTSSHRSKMRIQARPELCPLNDWLYIVYLVYKSMKNPKFKSQDNGMHGMQQRKKIILSWQFTQFSATETNGCWCVRVGKSRLQMYVKRCNQKMETKHMPYYIQIDVS